MNMVPRLTDLDVVRHAPLRVTILGLRGLPDVQGGVEKHVENLAPRLAALGCDVEVILRSPYVPKGRGGIWRDVRLVRLWSPRAHGIEPFLHTLLGVLRAAWSRPDVLHIHSIGPALFTPLARLFGLRVVVTHHMPNYQNEKWGLVGRAILRSGERAGMAFANGRIAVSEALAEHIRRGFAVAVRTIPNGISPPQPQASTTTLDAFGLAAGRYLLTVARIDPQKRQLDLIEAFGRARPAGWKLALVGGADYQSDYARRVEAAARATPGVVLLGRQEGAALAELYTHAGVFVLPSGHEGQPIAVLEAVSYGCPVLLSDILAHREIETPAAQYAAVGDIAGLAERLNGIFADPPQRLSEAERARLMHIHDWDRIAQHTLEVYRAALPGSREQAATPLVPANAGSQSFSESAKSGFPLTRE